MRGSCFFNIIASLINLRLSRPKLGQNNAVDLAAVAGETGWDKLVPGSRLQSVFNSSVLFTVYELPCVLNCTHTTSMEERVSSISSA